MSDSQCPQNHWEPQLGPCVCKGRVHSMTDKPMSDLPSREDAKSMLATHWKDLDRDQVWLLIAARAKGRLVDREAIGLIKAAGNRVATEMGRDDPPGYMTQDDMAFIAMVHAAIGDTDE